MGGGEGGVETGLVSEDFGGGRAIFLLKVFVYLAYEVFHDVFKDLFTDKEGDAFLFLDELKVWVIYFGLNI